MNRIRQLRELNGLSQEALGKLLGIQHSAVSKYELGKVPLNEDVIRRLTEIFDVSADFLLGKEPILTDEQQELCKMIAEMDSDSIQKFFEYAEYLRSHRNS